jgi:hypothetical protein
MDAFTLIVLGSLVLGVLFLIAVGFGTRHRPVSEFLDKKANERVAAQAVIEESETPQMVDANNEYRRKRGEGDLTLEDFRARANANQRVSIERAKKRAASVGSE